VTVIVDTGVLYADHDRDATRHESAREALGAVYLGNRLRGVGPYPQVYAMQRVSAAAFDEAVDVFEQYDDQALSFTDATTVWTAMVWLSPFSSVATDSFSK